MGECCLNLGFVSRKNKELEYFIIPSFEETGLVRHCFTTRRGGVSKGEVSSLNLGLKRKDTRENVLINFEIICKEINIDDKKLILSDQVHSDKIYIADKSDWGKGLYTKVILLAMTGL